MAEKCCYVRSWFRTGYAQTTLRKQSAYEGAMQQDCETLTSSRLPTDFFDIQADGLGICFFMGNHGMVDERIALLKRCTYASVRRMGLQDPALKGIVSDIANLLTNLEGS
jgi:hypothetical protein